MKSSEFSKQFENFHLTLSDSFAITTTKENEIFELKVFKHSQQVGAAHFITDCVDVGCIIDISIDDDAVNVLVDDKHTLGECLIKFLLKFPNQVRKPEFRFLLSPPSNLTDVIKCHHFDQGEMSPIENEIMIREKNIIPDVRIEPPNVSVSTSVYDSDISQILSLLTKTAYWQEHLTIDRLELLLSHSLPFIVRDDDSRVIGFARVLTDMAQFASLWDVVVLESYQRRGIGTLLMNKVFSHPDLDSIKSWVLFTDTAGKLYRKFGFVSAKEVPERILVHKLRLQDKHPDYMSELATTIKLGLPIQMNQWESLTFLFEEVG